MTNPQSKVHCSRRAPWRKTVWTTRSASIASTVENAMRRVTARQRSTDAGRVATCSTPLEETKSVEDQNIEAPRGASASHIAIDVIAKPPRHAVDGGRDDDALDAAAALVDMPSRLHQVQPDNVPNKK